MTSASHTKRKTSPVKVAIAGCGAVAELYYAPALAELSRIEKVQVSGVYDPDPGRLQRLRSMFKSAESYESIPAMCKQEIDLAIVASPPAFHSEQTIQLLKSGISVLCEKPMAVSVAEAQAMIDQSVRFGQTLSVNLFRRFFPSSQEVKQILSLGLLGKPVSFCFSEGGVFDWPIQSDLLFKRQTAGGGVLLESGVHVIDLLIWWFGDPLKISYFDDTMGGIEANCLIELAFAGGLSGKVRLSREHLYSPGCKIVCEKGWLKWTSQESNMLEIGIDDSDFALSARMHEIVDRGSGRELGDAGANYGQSFMKQLIDVADAATTGSSPLITGEEGIRSLKVIEKCYRNRKLMELAWFSEGEYNRARKLKTG